MPNIDKDRKTLCGMLKKVMREVQVPWCLMGDFNITISEKERIGMSINFRVMVIFKEFIDEMGLIHMPLVGRMLTYQNFREEEAFSILDGFSVNDEYIKIFTTLVQKRLLASLSDHNPIMLEKSD